MFVRLVRCGHISIIVINQYFYCGGQMVQQMVFSEYFNLNLDEEANENVMDSKICIFVFILEVSHGDGMRVNDPFLEFYKHWEV